VVKLQFDDVLRNLDVLLWGAWNTLFLSASAGFCGVAFAIVLCWVRTFENKPASTAIACYVELIRNTPFLVQAFFVFFGFPSIGLRLKPDHAAMLVMSINVSAYATEILRGGIEAIEKGYTEAAKSVGLSNSQTFFYVVLPPATQSVYPSLVSQFILLLLGSSVLSSISASELTSAANDLQNKNFKTSETYLVAAGIYLAMSTSVALFLRSLESALFPFARTRRNA